MTSEQAAKFREGTSCNRQSHVAGQTAPGDVSPYGAVRPCHFARCSLRVARVATGTPSASARPSARSRQGPRLGM